MMRSMALIAANRLTVTIPAGPDAPPSEATARERIVRWLEGEYGYRPPVECFEGHGWSESWEVGGRISPGWRYDAVIPRHLGPSRDEVAKARHPAGTGSPRRRTAPPARPASPARPTNPARSRRQPATRPAAQEVIDSLFPADSVR